MEKFKWGVIGAGKIAKRFLKDLVLLEEAQVSAITSQTFANAQSLAADYGARAFASLEEFLAADVDIVYIATPHPRHCQDALAAIGAGKAVLCEKPFTMNSREARQVIAAARAKRVFVMEALWTRFFPAFEAALELVQAGALGEPLTVQTSFGYASTADPASRVFSPALGGGSLLDVGVYCVSLAHIFCGDQMVHSESTMERGATGVDEAAEWTLRFASGSVARGQSAVIRALGNEAILSGSKGEIRMPQFWCPKEFQFHGKTHSFPSPGTGFQFEAREVMKALKDGQLESARRPLRDTLRVMETMDQLRAQWGLVYPCER